jgi:hypothetical protein
MVYNLSLDMLDSLENAVCYPGHVLLTPAQFRRETFGDKEILVTIAPILTISFLRVISRIVLYCLFSIKLTFHVSAFEAFATLRYLKGRIRIVATTFKRGRRIETRIKQTFCRRVMYLVCFVIIIIRYWSYLLDLDLTTTMLHAMIYAFTPHSESCPWQFSSAKSGQVCSGCQGLRIRWSNPRIDAWLD